MTLLLAIDTASAAVSVALHDGTAVLAERTAPPSPRHAELLSPLIAEVLAEVGATPAGLTRIAAGVGPGPFTGLRIGLVTAQVLGATLDVPVEGVCSLDAVALAGCEVVPEREFLVATDARRKEVYWGRYVCVDGFSVRLAGPEVSLPAAVDRAGLPVVGRGTVLYPELLGPGSPVLDPRAVDIARLALAGTDPKGTSYLLPPEPLYLRRPDAVPGVPKRAR